MGGYAINIYFGVPGSGKTTYAAWLAKKYLKRGRKVYTNVPIEGCYLITVQDFEKYHLEPNSLVIFDEAGIDFNNRDFKKFSPELNYRFKYHRHYKLDIVILSQSYNDMDKKIRLLARNLYVVKKSLIPYFIVVKRIGKKIGIDELSHDIIDQYFWIPWFSGGTQRVFTPILWKMFDSYDTKPMEIRNFKLCEVKPKK